MDLHALPQNLPVPEDDGAADHLPGARVPSIELSASGGEPIDLAFAAQETLVIYVYPATGVPGRPLPADWNQVPGARGCTPQSCAFRDQARDLAELGASVVGVSGQKIEEQREFAERERIPYPLLNDSEFALASKLGLPTFQLSGARYYRRLTFIACAGQIARVFYPVFPPEQNAAEVIGWLSARQLESAGTSR